jgi:hypothetical protein
LTEYVPPDVIDRIHRIDHLLPEKVVKTALQIDRAEVLDLLAASMQATSEALLTSKARFYVGAVFLGEIEDERRQQAEAHHVRDCYQEFQLYEFKLKKLQDLYDYILQSGSHKSSVKKRRAPVVRLFPDDDGAA